MQKIKKLIAGLALVAMTASFTSQIQADEVYYDGSGYEDSRTLTYAAPAIALGAVALIAVIAIVAQNNHHGHSHAHSH
jgi:hypothetical protein